MAIFSVMTGLVLSWVELKALEWQVNRLLWVGGSQGWALKFMVRWVGLAIALIFCFRLFTEHLPLFVLSFVLSGLVFRYRNWRKICV